MKKAIIIEDEIIAAESLKHQLAEVAPEFEIVQTLQGVEESIEWFEEKHSIDLVFMDIHLSDGIAFEIFKHVSVPYPIIFTTAYDQYAIQAFKVNSIDYLLKPINTEDLKQALDKLKRYTEGATKATDTASNFSQEQLSAVISALQGQQKNTYQNYFLIPCGDKLVPLDINDIAFFYLDNKNTYAYDFNRKKYPIDKPLDNVLELLDPHKFFRANRQYIIAHKAIKDILFWLGGKLCITLCISVPERIIVSKARATQFKTWYTR